MAVLLVISLCAAVALLVYDYKHVDPPGPVPPVAKIVKNIPENIPATATVEQSKNEAAKTPQDALGRDEGSPGPNTQTTTLSKESGQVPAEIQPFPTYKLQPIHRIDFSGVYFLREPYTWQNVVEIFLDGQPVNRDRVTIIDADRIDIWDSHLDSKVQAVVEVK